MGIYVRDASLIDDRKTLAQLAQQFLSPDADEDRFCWLYERNPFGPARAWIACEKHGEAIGMAAIFPGACIAMGRSCWDVSWETFALVPNTAVWDLRCNCNVLV